MSTLYEVEAENDIEDIENIFERLGGYDGLRNVKSGSLDGDHSRVRDGLYRSASKKQSVNFLTLVVKAKYSKFAKVQLLVNKVISLNCTYFSQKELLEYHYRAYELSESRNKISFMSVDGGTRAYLCIIAILGRSLKPSHPGNCVIIRLLLNQEQSTKISPISPITPINLPLIEKFSLGSNSINHNNW